MYLTMYTEEHFTFWSLQTLGWNHDVWWLIACHSEVGIVLKYIVWLERRSSWNLPFKSACTSTTIEPLPLQLYS